MRYSGWHLLGTARMGGDPATSVVDGGTGRTTCPTSTSSTAAASSRRAGSIPRRRICALALRAADHLVQTRRRAGGAGMSGGATVANSTRARLGRERRAVPREPSRASPDPGGPRDAGGRRRRRRPPSRLRAAGATRTSSNRCGARCAPSWVTTPAPASPPWPRYEPESARRAAARRRRRLLHRCGRPRRHRLSRPGGQAGDRLRLPGVHRGGSDRSGARAGPDLARPRRRRRASTGEGG